MLRTTTAALLLLFTAVHVATAQRPPAPTAALQPGDLLRVEIWREADLSGNFAIDPNGVVTLPLLGQKQVAGVPLDELRDRLIADYRVYLQNPSINITPLRRIYVLGEVNKPGLYVVDPTISLAGAVAVAGGVAETGDMNKIRVLRSGEVLLHRVGPAETLHTVDLRSGDEIYVDQRSWLQRNSVALLTTLISVSSSVLVAVLVSSRSSSSERATVSGP